MKYRGMYDNPAARMVELQIMRYRAQNGETPKFNNTFNNVADQDNKAQTPAPAAKKATPTTAAKFKR